MAYGAVRCLELTIERLLRSSHISIVPNSSPQIISLLYDEILSFKAALKEFDARRSSLNMKMVKTLEAEMIDAVYQFEDVLELHLSNNFHSQQETNDDDDHPPLMLLSVDVQEIKQDVDSFIETLNKMKSAYIHELYNPSPEEEEEEEEEEDDDDDDDDDDVVSSNMVGLSDLFMQIKDRLMLPRSETMFTSLVGMAGIGKTTLAKKLFQDPLIASRFSTCVFVTIGPKYRLADVLLDIITRVLAEINQTLIREGEVLAMLTELGQPLLEGLKMLLLGILRNRSYLIVLDDVWDEELIYGLFPDSNNGSRILVTCRMKDAFSYLSTFEIPFLDKKESWDLLRDKVFGDQPCSYGFEKAGRKIAKNCEGLPLTIVTVAKIISKANNKTLEYWNEVADDEQNSVYKDAYDQMSKVLYPSYDYLQQHLKACFLYLGAFPQNYPLYTNSSLIKLWSAEGFLNPTILLDTTKDSYIHQLYSRSVIYFLNNTETRQYHLHTSFWYLCSKEAAQTKLFYILNCSADALLKEGIKYQRRLCILNSILFAIRDARDSIASASTVRSLLCTGGNDEYPVPLCLEHLRLLRVFDARSIRFYEFPMEVVKLMQLRYITLVYDGNLPTSISKLLNLQYLTVDRRLIIREFAGNLSSYLPVEIWNMTELKCIDIMGRDLPHPGEGSLLPNLLTLAGVGPQSCTKDVLEKTPHLEELRIHIVLALDATEPLSCFDNISHLNQLHVLQCKIVNPTLKTRLVIPLTPLSDLPSNLSTIVLSGLGYPWEEMSKISLLPNLEYLILQCYAFRGPKWEVHDNEFKKLKSLDMQAIDLEHWKFVTTNSYMPEIIVVKISHCYKLREIPLTFGGSLTVVQVSECSPVAVNCFKELKQVWDAEYGDHERSLTLSVHSSLQ